jgi:hypothetical protein
MYGSRPDGCEGISSAKRPIEHRWSDLPPWGRSHFRQKNATLKTLRELLWLARDEQRIDLSTASLVYPSGARAIQDRQLLTEGEEDLDVQSRARPNR